MRKAFLTLALAASAFTAATVASRADDCDDGYSNYSSYDDSGYNAGYSTYRAARASVTTTYYACRTVTFRVWDSYTGTYVIGSRTVCN